MLQVRTHSVNGENGLFGRNNEVANIGREADRDRARSLGSVYYSGTKFEESDQYVSRAAVASLAFGLTTIGGQLFTWMTRQSTISNDIREQRYLSSNSNSQFTMGRDRE